MKYAYYIPVLAFLFATSTVLGFILPKPNLTIEGKKAFKVSENHRMLLKQCGQTCKPLKFTLNDKNECVCDKTDYY
ncbi:hypothetical protein BDB01DRAFT_804049, partial [Pilobolus umbonatus]